MVYLRPGNVYKDFTVETHDTTMTNGRSRTTYDRDTGIVLHASLADATPDQKDRWKQLQHPITHVLVQQGTPSAKIGDRLVQGDRVFYIQGVDEPGGLGLWTLYYVEERRDIGGA